MDQYELTSWGRYRLAAIILLFLLALLVPFPAPTYSAWKLEIVATEYAHFAAFLALALLIPGWRRGRYGVRSAILAFGAFCVDASPLVQAVRISTTLPARLEAEFGPVVARSAFGAPSLPKPLTLRVLLNVPPSPDVSVTIVNYAPRFSGFLQLDLYRNPGLIEPRPVVVVVHGGSWRGGGRGDLADLNYYLAARGYAVAAITYRLAPQFPNPAATEDLNEAIDYLKINAAPLGLDVKRIALIGRSAGGHLALLSAYTKHDPAIRGVVAFYPPTDQLFGFQVPSRIIASRQILRDYLSGTPASAPRTYSANSPINFVNNATVPTLLIHGTKDELVFVRHSRMLDERLMSAGRPHLLIELPWATHGCDYIFNGPCGQISTYAIERFLASVLR